MRSSSDVTWCNFAGKWCDSANIMPLSIIEDVQKGNLKCSPENIVFRNPISFLAGEIHQHYDVWSEILLEHHKREELLKYIRYGVSIFDFMQPFKGDFKGKSFDSDRPPPMIFSNSKSCDQFQEFISESILERVRNGSLCVWGKEGHCQPPHLVMPITIEPTKPRMCHDERYLNLWMKAPHIHFDPITDLPRYVQKNHYQSKMDDKSGYDHIMLTAASRKFFGLFWQGWFFVYNTLPFGWSPSAYVYHSVGLGASSFIRSKGVPLSQYIDDRHVGQLCLPSRTVQAWTDLEMAKAAAFITALVLVKCGYFIGLKKSVFMPVQSITFLGLIVDSTTESFQVPKEKKEKFAKLRETILQSKVATVKTLQRFAGKAASFSLAVPAARLYIREVNAGISKGIKTSIPTFLTNDLRGEIEHWRFLDSWQGSLCWREEKHISVSLCSDASNSGWGGVFSFTNDPIAVRDYWDDEEKALPIAIREALALYRTLLSFSNKVENCYVDAYVDNKNLLHFWNNQGGKNISLTRVIKDLFNLCLKLNSSLNLYYMPSSEIAADAPSRVVSDLDCTLSSRAWNVLEKTYGPHDIDLMAIPSNVKCGTNGAPLKFFSPYPCPQSSGVNIFAQEIRSDDNCYVFPPFVLIGPLLKFLRASQVRVTLVVPDISPRKYWWPVVSSLAVDSVVLGKKNQSDVLLFPPNKSIGWHTKPLQWDLIAFRLFF